jgi:DNA-binding transcriptional MerR regulator
MDHEGQMTIEELANQAGTATTTVRMYQSKGLPPPERRGRIGCYGHGHLARLRLIAQLQEQGFSLASIKQLTDAWESGRGLDDILGLETQVAAVWAPEPPARLKLSEFRALLAQEQGHVARSGPADAQPYTEPDEWCTWRRSVVGGPDSH